MDMLKRIALIAVAMLMVVSAISVATADVNLGPNATKVGNFALYQNSTTGAIYNLSFVNDNYDAVIASSVNATGNAVVSSNLSSYNSDNVKTIGNLTVFTAGNENTLIMSTQSVGLGSSASITLNLNSPVSKLNLTTTQHNYLQSNTGNVAASYLANNMYKVSVNNTQFILFSTVNVSVANGAQSVTYTKSGGMFYNQVFVGISPLGALKDTIEKEVRSHENPFTYNNTTGMVNGRFVSFNVNPTSGVISQFTDVQSNATIFTSIQASGNGTIGADSPSSAFAAMQPIVAGNVFFFGNNTVVYQMHNNPSIVQNTYLSNGTLTYNVNSGLNISVFNPPKEDVGSEHLNASTVNYTGVNLGDQFDIPASSTIVFIHNSTFKGSLFVHGATVSVNNATGVVTITTNGTAHVTFVAPPGLQHLEPTVRESIQYAIDHGKLAALVVLGSAGNSSSNLSVSYNSSMQINVQNVSTGSITVKVGSLNHEGTNFAIFVPNNVIQNNSKITLKFDSQVITLSKNMNNVVNATSTTQATFYYVQVSGGTLVVIHVPHFSQHTIQISTSSATTGTGLPGLSGQTGLYAALGVLVVIGVVAGVVLVRRKK